jgi:hypothetical protein
MVYEWLCIWYRDGVITEGENWSTQTATCHSLILSTTHPTWTAMGWNLGHYSEKLPNSLTSYNIDPIIYLNFNYKESIPTIPGLLDTACLYCYEQACSVFRLMKRYLLCRNCKIILFLVLSWLWHLTCPKSARFVASLAELQWQEFWVDLEDHLVKHKVKTT